MLAGLRSADGLIHAFLFFYCSLSTIGDLIADGHGDVGHHRWSCVRCMGAHDSLDDWSGGRAAGMVVQDTELFLCSPGMAPEAPPVRRRLAAQGFLAFFIHSFAKASRSETPTIRSLAFGL